MKREYELNLWQCSQCRVLCSTVRVMVPCDGGVQLKMVDNTSCEHCLGVVVMSLTSGRSRLARKEQ
jgi:hypothetical protein